MPQVPRRRLFEADGEPEASLARLFRVVQIPAGPALLEIWLVRSCARSLRALTGLLDRGKPRAMPTPDDVLQAIGTTLLNEGCITEFRLEDDATQENNDLGKDRTLVVKLNTSDQTELTIESQCNQSQNVLSLTGEVCPEILVDLAARYRNIRVEGKAIVPVGSAVRNILNHYRSYLVSTSASA